MIPMEGARLRRLRGGADRRAGKEIAERAEGLAIDSGPVEAVVVALGAQEALRVGRGLAVAARGGLLALGVDIGV